MRTFKNQMQAFAIKQLLKYVERDPEVNAAKALKIIRKIDLDGTYGSSWDELEKCLQDPASGKKGLYGMGSACQEKTIRIPDM